MKNLLVIALMIPMVSFAQEFIELQPHYDDGNNTYIRSGAPTDPAVAAADLAAYTWTCGGDLCLGRGLFTFDLDNVVSGSTIISATLYLYVNATTALGFGSDEPQAGTNAAHIFRVTEDWDYATVTWSTQPSISMDNAVALEESTDPFQDYTVDVTALIQDWIDDPDNSFGMTLRLDDEVNYYSSMLFCSSFYPDEAKHPKLSINYTLPLGVEDIATQQFSLAPNPSSGDCIIQLNTETSTPDRIGLYDITGRLLQWMQVEPGSNSVVCSTADLPAGIYFIEAGAQGSGKLEVVH